MTRMTSDLRLRVTTGTAIAVVALAVPAAWLAGASGAVGILAAGALTVGNFWWLARAAVGADDPTAPRRDVGGFILGAGARYAVLFVAFAALCAGGYAHPVAVVVGLSVLPCAVIAQGLRSARESEETR
jgi:ATP synthase I chain